MSHYEDTRENLTGFVFTDKGEVKKHRKFTFGYNPITRYPEPLFADDSGDLYETTEEAQKAFRKYAKYRIKDMKEARDEYNRDIKRLEKLLEV